jgi:hypothetical protein
VWGICSDNPRGSFTILDNVLTVIESAGGEEQACRPHPHPGGLLEGAGGGGGLHQGTPALIRAVREVREDSWQPHLEELPIQNGPTITIFFILRSLGYQVNTLRILSRWCGLFCLSSLCGQGSLVYWVELVILMYCTLQYCSSFCFISLKCFWLLNRVTNYFIIPPSP